tara:strand:- start:1147 stop:1488 length:342 start_codon:yes stop_codon:yes gene_type:complete
MNFEKNIKSYITLDNDIQELNERIKKLKNEKIILLNNIINYIENNELENVTIKINNGQLNYIIYKQPQLLTYKFLKQCFDLFFKDKIITNNLIDFIKKSREIRYSKELKRTYN